MTGKKASLQWSDASNNFFFLEKGVVLYDCIQFKVKRRRGAPALAFDQGETLFLSFKKNFYTVVVENFIPRSLCGSVIAASGLLTIELQKDVALAVDDIYDAEENVFICET